MTLSLHNTLTRRVEPFQPLVPPRVTLYTCGPTVWNYAHIGNFRTFLFEDLLRRHLEFSGYEVFHIMNLTDVDDRTIKAAAAAGKRLAEHTAPFVEAFFEDSEYLRIRPAHVYPRATESVPAMVALVERLLERGVAYKGEDGSVYFAIGKFPGYGRLSNLDRRELKVGARVASDEYKKDDPRDFALWKKAEPIDEQVGAAWDAPFGRGRPGWHLECSAMSLRGASSPEARGVITTAPGEEGQVDYGDGPMVRHPQTGKYRRTRLFVLTLGYSRKAVRLLVWQTHYRQPLDLNDEALEGARQGVKRLGELHERLRERGRSDSAGPAGTDVLAGLSRDVARDVAAALDDDLNAPQAVATVFDFVRAANRELDRAAGGAATALATFERIMGVLDVLPTPRALTPEFRRWIEEQLAARERARKTKDFEEADRIRVELRARDVELEDTPSGTKWRVL